MNEQILVNRSLSGKVALVTGASRGVGKGIALQLAAAGATVYITARTAKPSKEGQHSVGSLAETVDDIKRRGGKCIAVKMDHEKDSEILELFQQIGREQNNRLDILVNCAFKGVNTMFNQPMGIPFWEMPPEIWDDINNVGLRNNYICTVYAARMMVPAKQGLIINISSIGGVRYMLNVPYGVGKCGVDRMSNDCGLELRANNITCLSLYPGAVKTELIMDTIKTHDPKMRVGNVEVKMSDFFKNGETPEFTGRVVVALATDPKLMSYSSKALMVADYANCHGIRDIDNRQIASVRQLASIAQLILPDRLQIITRFIPGFVKVPNFMLSTLNSWC